MVGFMKSDFAFLKVSSYFGRQWRVSVVLLALKSIDVHTVALNRRRVVLC